MYIGRTDKPLCRTITVKPSAHYSLPQERQMQPRTRILILEDEPLLAHGLKYDFKVEDAARVSVATYQAAMDALNLTQIDFAILDWGDDATPLAEECEMLQITSLI